MLVKVSPCKGAMPEQKIATKQRKLVRVVPKQRAASTMFASPGKKYSLCDTIIQTVVMVIVWT